MTDTAPEPTLKLDEPSATETSAILDDFFGAMRQNTKAGRAAVELARPALERLCVVMQDRCGQPYKVRALLYSLYNGQPTSLLEIVCLDRNIREDLCAVLLAFGFEHSGGESFFYAEMKAAITAAGQWTWFLDAHESEVEA